MLTAGVAVSGRTIAIEIYEWENIYQLKQEVEMREGVPARHHHLQLGNKIVWDRKKICDCGDVKDRTFFMIPAAPDAEERKVEVHVETGMEHSKVYTITIRDKYTTTVGFLRKHLEGKYGVVTRDCVITEVEQDDTFHSWPLDESVTLYNHNIRDGHQLQLRPREPHELIDRAE